jgi:hypothetical protein
MEDGIKISAEVNKERQLSLPKKGNLLFSEWIKTRVS